MQIARIRSVSPRQILTDGAMQHARASSPSPVPSCPSSRPPLLLEVPGGRPSSARLVTAAAQARAEDGRAEEQAVIKDFIFPFSNSEDGLIHDGRCQYYLPLADSVFIHVYTPVFRGCPE